MTRPKKNPVASPPSNAEAAIRANIRRDKALLDRLSAWEKKHWVRTK